MRGDYGLGPRVSVVMTMYEYVARSLLGIRFFLLLWKLFAFNKGSYCMDTIHVSGSLQKHIAYSSCWERVLGHGTQAFLWRMYTYKTNDLKVL